MAEERCGGRDSKRMFAIERLETSKCSAGKRQDP